MADRRPPRLVAECYQGCGRYFLTICAYERREYFARADCVERAERQLMRTAADYRFEGIAYCFMPDHLHALFEAAAEDSDFIKFVCMFKQRSGFAHKRRTGDKLWQDGYFDRVLRREEATLDVVAYIVKNPVSAHLCTDPREYPFIGSTLYSVDDLFESMVWRSGRWRP